MEQPHGGWPKYRVNMGPEGRPSVPGITQGSREMSEWASRRRQAGQRPKSRPAVSSLASGLADAWED